MKADTKLTVVMCWHIFDRRSVAPSSGDFRWKPQAPRRTWCDKSQRWTSLNKKSELELELFSSNYSPRAGAGAFTLQHLLLELELELLGSETFQRAGAGAYKLQTVLPELELELRV